MSRSMAFTKTRIARPVLSRSSGFMFGTVSVESAIRIGLALNCQIAEWCRFARKNYFYPDMPKNFQTSQYDEPIAYDGWTEVEVDGLEQRLGENEPGFNEELSPLPAQAIIPQPELRVVVPEVGLLDRVVERRRDSVVHSRHDSRFGPVVARARECCDRSVRSHARDVVRDPFDRLLAHVGETYH